MAWRLLNWMVPSSGEFATGTLPIEKISSHAIAFPAAQSAPSFGLTRAINSESLAAVSDHCLSLLRHTVTVALSLGDKRETTLRSLELVDLVDANDGRIDGLVSVRDPSSAESAQERAVLIEAAAFEPVSDVFFRRFKEPDGKHIRSSQVAAYVINNSNLDWGEDELARWHQDLWLHGSAPLIYVAWPTRVDILTCARQPDFWRVSANGPELRYSPAERISSTISLASRQSGDGAGIPTAAAVEQALQRRLSAYRLAEGTFWDFPENQKLAKADAAAHPSLIQAVAEADVMLDGAKHRIRRRLLILTILIKYLEDRGVFPGGLFGRFHVGARSFLDILRDGTVDEVKRLLGYFEKRKFNGDVFSLGDEADALTPHELNRFAVLIEARELGGQKHFWELFSFKYIPVEVISRIYQRFVTSHGAVYTPPLLASLLLDQVMPYHRLSGKEKILDPACGSGVFLVGAFKRLVIHWRSQRGWRRPTVKTLKSILRNSIHGVELEPSAVDLTAFSLAIALCDALEPPVIWARLKFDKLRGRNLREGDYFDAAVFGDSSGHRWPSQFDVIVGNPPFQSSLTGSAKTVDEARAASLPRLPDKQSAYLFLEAGLKSLRQGGALCLIQPHGLLYNSQTSDFRRYLMEMCPLRAIFDFVSLRGLYEGADPKTIAWHAINLPPATDTILHFTFRRTYSAAERISFEIDHYDCHFLSRSDAAQNPFVWRIDLLGGGRLHEIADRFRQMTTLEEFILKKGPEWDYGEGYIAGKAGKRSPAPFLTGKPLLPTRAFTDAGIDRTQVGPGKAIVRERLFKSAYDERRYTPPLVLMKAHESLPIEFWDEGFIAYRHKILGIHAPKSAEDELRALYEVIREHRELYQFLCALNGTQALTGKATVPLKQDINLLPIPEVPAELTLSFWEEAMRRDVTMWMSKYIRRGQRSELLTKRATKDVLQQYSDLYVRLLGTVCPQLTAYTPIFLDGLIAQPFYIGDRPSVSWLGSSCEKGLHQLVYARSRAALLAVRVVRYYEGNVILIVKPERLRYWIPSTAVRDADETLVDLHQQGW